MGDRSRIESVDASWNPTYGCSTVSRGCHNCYARRIAAKSAKPGQVYYGIAKYSPSGAPRWTGRLVHATEKTWEPLRWQDGRMIAVDTMSDLFHERIPDAWRDEAYGVMALCPQHTFQVLTKRPQGMERYFSAPDIWKRIEAEARRIYRDRHGNAYPSDGQLQGPLPNVWHGVSVENQSAANYRVPMLLKVPSARHYVAAEPLLAPIRLSHWLGADRVSWVLISGEGGPEARPCDVVWIRSLIEQGSDAGVSIFVKQLGSATNVQGATHETGHQPVDTRTRRASEMEEWPEAVRVRQMPDAA
jgi:protein gp37